MTNKRQKIQLIEMHENGVPFPEILTTHNSMFKPCLESSLRTKLSRWKRDLEPDPIVLAIGDIHIPFTKKGYLEFCVRVAQRFGVTHVVFMGDIIDHHAISRHDSETEAMSPIEEYKQTLPMLQEWIEAFPNAYVCLGNHDKIPMSQAKKLKLGTPFLKTLSEAYNLPDTWELDHQHIINGVLYRHGVASGGIHGTLNYALLNGMSTAVGHKHTVFGVRYITLATGKTLFAVDVGCGVDQELYAFAYAKEQPKKFQLGCAVIFSPTEAMSIPFTLDK